MVDFPDFERLLALRGLERLLERLLERDLLRRLLDRVPLLFLAQLFERDRVLLRFLAQLLERDLLLPMRKKVSLIDD